MAEAARGRTVARAEHVDRAVVHRAVTAALQEGVLLLDDRGVVVEANDAAVRMLGLPPGGLRGQSPRDGRWRPLRPDGTPLAPEEHPALVALATGKAAELLMKVHRRDTSVVWLRVRAEPLLEEGETRPSGAVAILTDMTEVVSARETLSAVERIANVASWRWDFGVALIEWSPELNRMFGLSSDDASIGLPAIDDFVHPDDRATLTEVRDRAIRAHQPFEFEVRVVRHHGTQRVVVSAGEPIEGPEGKLLGYRGTVQDVTRERERETRLREREEQLRALIDNSPDSIVRIDRELRHVDLNQAVLDQAGVPADFILGRSVQELGFNDSLSGVWVNELTAVFETGEARMYEYEMPLPAGPRWFESRAAPEFGPTGEVEHVVIVSRDVTVRRRAGEALAHQATHDGLTGLPNRRVLLDTLDDLSTREPAARFAVLELDVDRFKLVNDLLGHPAGDALLVAFAARLRGAVREGDLLTRLGGDEFVVVAHRIEGREDAARAAERVQRALREPITVQGQELRPSASIGISLPGAGTVSATELLSRADAAMYLAKERGRDRYEFFDDELRARVAERLSVETALRRALSNDELVVHYQPEVNLATGEVIGVEALVRWERPDHGLLSAAEFVPVAEESGLIVELGGRVLQRAAADAARWHQQHPDRPFVVRVNLSARQLADPDLIDEVRAVLTDIDLPEGMLWFELTETVLMSDTPLVRANVAALRRLGLPIAIDDFGSGYSSLAYLKRLPAAAIKIDREFIEHLPASIEDTAIVKAIVLLGQTIDAVVIAEGIETEEQRDALLDLGCTRAQGHLFGPAVPAEQIDEQLAAAVPTG
jgi:diguanylate cyclase (GGDEF)-like protein/PAS domain S-box-containing protein